jgi:hypothetical protein
MAAITHATGVFPVTQKFQDEVLAPYPHLATATYEQLELMRSALLNRSNLRSNYMLSVPKDHPMAPGGTLTVVERAELDAVTHLINVHHGINFLQGRSHTDFGFDGVDQVHGNADHKACGCVDTYVFDHHKRHEPDVKLHPHYPKHVCPTNRG